MPVSKIAIGLLFIIISTGCMGQTPLPKVSHAEPIYFDLIRDLGARKGEKELNAGLGMTHTGQAVDYHYLVEYEFAPINRLGLELEVPLLFHTTSTEATDTKDTRANNGMEGIKAAVQYSFFVSPKLNTTLAIGYIFETKREGFNIMHATGTEHNPFFIAAKKWGRQFHTLVYTGPSYEFDRETGELTRRWIVNSNVHYVLPNTKNFVGIEVNQVLRHHHAEMVLRPQVKMTLSSSSAIGIAWGIDTSHEHAMDFLVRWIYELPKKK
jgi:hypothetical protein